ncbi:MAG: ATPase [Gammaproteobacteria bacterium]|nr:ATPase [Gammaproteobacteria bacterium]
MRGAVLSLLLCLPGVADAEVLDAAAGGFTVRHSVTIEATRREAYDFVVRDIGKWWHDDHTMSGSAARLHIDAKPMGCFCETLGDGAGLVHLVVTFANPGVMLRLTGGLGPLGLMGASGNLTFDFAESDGATTVTLQYAVGGYRAGGMDEIAPAVDFVLTEALDRYARYVATGSPQE